MDRPAGTEVLLMATCLCDAFFADVARAAVQVLEHLGCRVRFPEDQTCCGQPAFNSGDFRNGRRVARHAAAVFAGDLPVIVPSGSCAAMLSHGNGLQFENESDAGAMAALGRRSWEICDFIVNGLGVESWQGRLPPTAVTVHHSCHTRGGGTGAAARHLLGGVEGVTLREPDQADQCCGFGGTFAVAFPHISSEMGQVKLAELETGNPDWIVSADMSCLMHLAGLAERAGGRLPIRHVVQVLRDSLEKPT